MNINAIQKFSEFFYKAAQEDVSLDLAHNIYLLKVLRNFVPDLSLEEANQFAEENRKNINRLRRFFTREPRHLESNIPLLSLKGSGSSVFNLGGEMVAKFFIDQFAFAKAKEAMERLESGDPEAKSEAMIYEVDLLGKLPRKEIPLYYLVMEELMPVTEYPKSTREDIAGLIKFILKRATEILGRFPADRSGDLKEAKANLRRDIDRVISDCYSDPSAKILVGSVGKLKRGDLRSDWLEMLVEDIFDKIITGRGDLNYRNLGVTRRGTLCFFDPAHAHWEGKVNL